MRVFLDATVMQQPATGIAKSTLCLYQACIERFPELEVAAIHRRPLQCALPSRMEDLQRSSYLPGVAWAKLFLPAFVALKRPAAVHFPWNGRVPKGITSKVVTTLNDVLPLVIPGALATGEAEREYRETVQRDIDRTDLLITISQYSKGEILKNFKVKHEPVVVPLGPTLNSTVQSQATASAPAGSYFIYLGGYDRRKGIDRLLEVFIELHREGKLQSKLILSGSKHYFSPEFKELITRGVGMGIVEERGYVPDEELVPLLKGAKALVYPSKYEGFGLPPLEAMALGCPVITTRSTSVPEICGDAAHYVDPDDELSFSGGLLALENDTVLANDLRDRGLEHAKKYSWQKSADIFMAALRSLQRP